jgi:hypothetical protein
MRMRALVFLVFEKKDEPGVELVGTTARMKTWHGLCLFSEDVEVNHQ